MKNLSRIALAVVMMASASLNAASDTPAAVSEQTTSAASTPVETVATVVDAAPVATTSEPAPAVNSVPAETVAPVAEVEGPVYGPALPTAEEKAAMQGRLTKVWNSTKTFAGTAKDFAAAKATASKTFAQDQYKTNPTRTITISTVVGVAALAAIAKLAYNKWVKRSSCNDESCDVQA